MDQRGSTKAYVPSPQQKALFDWVRYGSGNAAADAVAGAGKTTTLAHATALMRGSTLFCAYNKDAANDIKAKVQQLGLERKDLFISTVHSAGFGAVRRVYKNVQVQEKKTWLLIDEMAEENPARYLAMQRQYGAFVNKMVSFGKQYCFGWSKGPAVDDMGAWLRLVEHFSADEELPSNVKPEDALEYVMDVYEKSMDRRDKVIDFDDMVFLPVAFDLPMFKNYWVLVDEYQDINPARRALVHCTLDPKRGRALFVGDPRQSIYGFTGAGGDACDKVVEEFRCQKLPLTVTYRCPKQVVSYVQKWVSHIEAHPSAPQGVVREIVPPAEAIRPWFWNDKPEPNDAVLCRYTRPLIQTAYTMLREGIPCKVQGRDIGKSLVKLAQRWKITSLDELDQRLDDYLALETDKAVKTKSDKRKIDAEDKVATLRIFMERCRAKGSYSIGCVVDEIETMFADEIRGVTVLCTGHKAKGREWRRVWWLQASTRSRRKLLEWEELQEANVQYVIGTRAQQELVLVPEHLHTPPQKRD